MKQNPIEITATVIPQGRGKGKTTNTILTVLYPDGNVFYRCSDCDMEFARFHSTMGHRSKHSSRKMEKVSVRSSKAAEIRKAIQILSEIAEEPTNGEVRKLVRDNALLRKRLSEERHRRRSVEKTLIRIREALPV